MTAAKEFPSLAAVVFFDGVYPNAFGVREYIP